MCGPHHGDLRRFGALDARVDLPDAEEVAEHLRCPSVAVDGLDHGAVVPLLFLWEAGWRGPTSVLALPRAEGDPLAVGEALASMSGETAVIASGDMSHRLREGAPGGFHVDAHKFDAAFLDVLRRDAWDEVAEVPYRAVAAEDVVRSVRVAMGAAGRPNNTEVLAYEAPFGVGYAQAILRDPQPPMYAVARAAVAGHVRGTPRPPPVAGPARAPVFVTLRSAEGCLRGCMGRMKARRSTLYAEVAEVAVLAATGDPRFEPVVEGELGGLTWEVSVLGPTLPVQGPQQLDPAVWGAVMRAANGRRSVLLPDVPGITTVAKQLAVLRSKGKIDEGESVTLERFAVSKSVEPR